MSNPLLEIYNGAVLAAPISFTLGPGGTSSVYSRSLWNLRDAAGDTALGLSLVLEALDAGQWKRSGVPVLDQLWGTIKVTSVTNDGDPTFGPFSSGTRRLGANNEFELPNLPNDCAINFDLQFFGPATISTAALEVRLVPRWDENSIGLASKIGHIGNGVVPATRDLSKRRVLVGRNIITAGTDSITVERGVTARDGVEIGSVRSAHTLNQNDSVPSALTAGQSYIACLSQTATGTITVTKGLRGATPAKPAIPAGEDWIAWVTVSYEAGGTSIIEDADVDQASLLRGDYIVTAGSGLAVKINTGAAIGTTSNYVWNDSPITLGGLTASDTNYIWLLPNGTGCSATLTEVAPMDGAELLAEADTNGSAVTAIRDRRAFLSAAIDELPLELREASVSATGTGLDYVVVPFDGYISRVRMEAWSISGGASGSYVVDINTIAEGSNPTTATTIFTGQGTDDRRVSIAYNATDLHDEEIYHEVRYVKKGQRISFDVDAIPAGGTATDVRVIVYLRRSR